MNQPRAYPYPSAPPPKKSNKKWIFIGGIVLIVCAVCCVLAVSAGYFYYQQNTAQTNPPGESLKPTQTGADPALEQAGPKEMEEIKTFGAAVLPLEVTVAEGMRVVKQAAFVVPSKDSPILCDVYVAILLENTTLVMDVDMKYKNWGYDSTGGPVTLRDSGGGTTGTIIPLHQTGAVLLRRAGFRIDSIPVKYEIILSPKTIAQPMANKGLQASWDALNLPNLPNPFFKSVSAEIVANPQPSGAFYDIEVNGKFINNLPVKNYTKGLFFFYDEGGQIVGVASSNWEKKASDLVEPQAEGVVNAHLPFALAGKPARVEFYTYMDLSNVVNLQKMNK
jgi:hypothetical protein